MSKKVPSGELLSIPCLIIFRWEKYYYNECQMAGRFSLPIKGYIIGESFNFMSRVWTKLMMSSPPLLQHLSTYLRTLRTYLRTLRTYLRSLRNLKDILRNFVRYHSKFKTSFIVIQLFHFYQSCKQVWYVVQQSVTFQTGLMGTKVNKSCKFLHLCISTSTFVYIYKWCFGWR